ncbi:hypothetical protein SAMN05216223_12945 [Actinacidiphila yanglinensis]|uniref:Uncharacterized protein n=1 Tax=Actinacidiphila yanglinensis TaxID=310779 RepID=A0A1H6EBF8_9ACTN|nr:hypothetical protein SAMN05216223_12945 [Actinacidiphila yanglinensis]
MLGRPADSRLPNASTTAYPHRDSDLSTRQPLRPPARGLLGALEEITNAEARSLFDLNVFGLINVTRAVLPVMRKGALQPAAHAVLVHRYSSCWPIASFITGVELFVDGGMAQV